MSSVAQTLVPFNLTFKVIAPTDTSIKVETFKFYISDLKLVQHNTIVFSNSNFYKLIDLSKDLTQTITTSIPSNLYFDKIIFNLGIDSNTNKMGIQGGDLDPTNEMYWSWQSGYINIKLEGSSSKCKTRKNKFQFHIGGFLADQYALQTIELPTHSNYQQYITINLNNFFNSVDISKVNSIMIPGKEAIGIAEEVKLRIKN